VGEPTEGRGTASAVVTEAYAAARELLRRADEDAARIRADADRYVQRRQQEAELVVGKARRVLAIAEERAAAIEAGTLPGRLPASPAPVDLPPAAVDLPDAAIDLTEAATAPPVRRAPRLSTELDSILAGAVSRAIDRALPTDR
jgi:hypothetical protein